MIPILMYHQIAPMPQSGPYRGLSVPPSKFRRQMQWLKRLGYQGLSMQQLLPYIKGEKRGKVFGITFDDGYQNVFENALPVLRDLGFSSTVYMVAGHFGGWNFWDSSKGIARSELMTIAQLKEWQAAAQEIGAHTVDHTDLTQLSLQEAKYQIEQARSLLQAVFGQRIESFCYPYGQYNADICALTQAAGYSNSTIVSRGLALPSDNLYALPRVTVSGTLDLASFLLKVLTRKEHRKRFKKTSKNKT